MVEIQTVVALLVVVALFATLSRRMAIPYPILMVIGGALLGFVPGVPRVELDSEIVLLLFLPPILFGAAFLTSPRDLRDNARPIGLLAFGLVLVTTVSVAVVAHALVPDIGWGAAFALGAIVSPPDAIAATAVAQRMGLPRRTVVILEGESLVNDATALVAYRFAVVAVVTGGFSLAEAGLRLPLVAAGGVLIGLIVGWVVVWIEERLRDVPVEILVSLLAPFAAYLPAEQLGVSGVLAAVTAGVYVGSHAARALRSESRVLGGAVWDMVMFLINGLAFVLLGLQLPEIVADADRTLLDSLVVAAAVCVTVVGVRLAWIFPATYVPRWLVPSIARRDPAPPWRFPLVIGWSGMRGVVSLAAALGLPAATTSGAPFPERELIVLVTFAVIVTTLVGQGLTLPWLIRRLGVRDDRGLEGEEAYARSIANQAALERLEGLAVEWPTHRELVDSLRARYDHRGRHTAGPEERNEEADQELLEHQQIRHEVTEAERLAVIELRDTGRIHDEVLRRIERELDLE
ncbi:MAG: Na+/H+ antiporter, partial [Chloroflexota bacterium]|nr:Na+/H+ antiporter [Chloroflexota bacterium]